MHLNRISLTDIDFRNFPAFAFFLLRVQCQFFASFLESSYNKIDKLVDVLLSDMYVDDYENEEQFFDGVIFELVECDTWKLVSSF